MNKKQKIDVSIKDHIISIVKTEKPETVNHLIELVRQRYQLKEQEITEITMQLENEGKIRFSEKEISLPLTPQEYIFSSKATWYWTTITLVIATTLTVFTVPEDAYPIVYVRYILGSIFVLWLPGYAFIRALFPRKAPSKTSTKELDSIERIALSIGMSLALVPIVGLLLNYTPFGIRLTPITLSLSALTITFATAAIIREQKASVKQNIPYKDN